MMTEICFKIILIGVVGGDTGATIDCELINAEAG